MQKSSTMRRTASRISKGRQLTIGVDLGDRWSFCALLISSIATGSVAVSTVGMEHALKDLEAAQINSAVRVRTRGN